MNVQSSWTTIVPGREEDVGWSGEGVGDQIGHLSRRGQAADWTALKRTLQMAL